MKKRIEFLESNVTYSLTILMIWYSAWFIIKADISN